ncbi:MAG: PIN domain-containing protein, partial [Fimbriimonadales bacterium]|nr:PIN domain-containing protein [Fimbriimonadales bacterium]
MSGDLILLDTSGLFSVIDQSDARHAQARQWFLSLRPKVVHNYVLAELIPLCRSRGIPLQQMVEFSRALLQNPLIKVIWIDEAVHHAALLLIESRADKTYSLCD